MASLNRQFENGGIRLGWQDLVKIGVEGVSASVETSSNEG
jgi:hypothetical protein